MNAPTPPPAQGDMPEGLLMPEIIYVHRSEDARDENGVPDPSFLWLSYDPAEEGYMPYTEYVRADLTSRESRAGADERRRVLLTLNAATVGASNGFMYVTLTSEEMQTIQRLLSAPPAPEYHLSEEDRAAMSRALRKSVKLKPAPDAPAVDGGVSDDALRAGVKAFQHAYSSDNTLADWRIFYNTVRAYGHLRTAPSDALLQMQNASLDLLQKLQSAERDLAEIKAALRPLVEARKMASAGTFRYAEHDDPGDDNEVIFTYWINCEGVGAILNNLHDFQVVNSDDLKFLVVAANTIAEIAPLIGGSGEGG